MGLGCGPGVWGVGSWVWVLSTKGLALGEGGGLGYGAWGLESGVWGLGPGALGVGLGCRAWGVGCGAWGLGPGVWGVQPGVGARDLVPQVCGPGAEALGLGLPGAWVLWTGTRGTDQKMFQRAQRKGQGIGVSPLHHILIRLHILLCPSLRTVSAARPCAARTSDIKPSQTRSHHPASKLAICAILNAGRPDSLYSAG